MESRKNILKIVPIFLLGSRPSLIGKSKDEQETKTDEILERFGLKKESKVLVRKEEARGIGEKLGLEVL